MLPKRKENELGLELGLEPVKALAAYPGSARKKPANTTRQNPGPQKQWGRF